MDLKSLVLKLAKNLDNASMMQNLSFSMEIRLKNCSLTVTLRHTIKFEVIKHSKVWKRHHDHQEYLGFYTLDSHHLSASVHGLLGTPLRTICLVLNCDIFRISKMSTSKMLCCVPAGQFYHGIELEVTVPLLNSNAIMYVKGQGLNVTR